MIVPFTLSPEIDPPSVLTITIESCVFGISGVIMGSIIDKEFKKLSKKNKDFKLLLSILQLALSGLILGIMYVYISSFFTDHFQGTLSGLAFPTMFYGVQSNLYSPWQD